jgi:hypothetical protein
LSRAGKSTCGKINLGRFSRPGGVVNWPGGRIDLNGVAGQR